MLANNTCDLEVDIRNHRFTLVYYLGKARAVALYTGLQVLPWLVLLGLANKSHQAPDWQATGQGQAQ